MRATTAASPVSVDSPPLHVFRAPPPRAAVHFAGGIRGTRMARHDNIRLTRRDMLKLSAGGAGMFMIGAGGLAIPKGFAGGGGGGGGGSIYIEAFPTSPLIMK